MHFEINFRSVSLFLLMSMAWVVGSVEFYHVITDFGNQWYWLALSVAYGLVLAELFCHLSVSHQMVDIDTDSWFYKLLVFLYTVYTPLGSIRGMCLTHTAHHMYADVKYLDPLDSRRMMHLTCSLSPLMYISHVRLDPVPNSQRYFDHQRKKFADILNDSWTEFCDAYTVPLIVFTWGLVYLCLPIEFFNMLMLGRLMVSVSNFVATLGHFKLIFGYRHFNTKDKSHNHLLFHYLFGCLCPSMLQHNHHGMNLHTPMGHKHKWYEFDLGGWIIRHVFTPLMAKKK